MKKLSNELYGRMRRRLGAGVAGGAVLGAAILFMGICFVPTAARGLSHETYEALAQVGATLLVAFAIEIASVVRDTRATSDRDVVEEFVGRLVAASGLGLAGVLFALVAAELSRRGSASALEVLSGGVAIGAVVMLGIFVATAPLIWWWKREAAIERELAAVDD